MIYLHYISAIYYKIFKTHLSKTIDPIFKSYLLYVNPFQTMERGRGGGGGGAGGRGLEPCRNNILQIASPW